MAVIVWSKSLLCLQKHVSERFLNMLFEEARAGDAEKAPERK